MFQSLCGHLQAIQTHKSQNYNYKNNFKGQIDISILLLYVQLNLHEQSKLHHRNVHLRTWVHGQQKLNDLIQLSNQVTDYFTKKLE